MLKGNDGPRNVRAPPNERILNSLAGLHTCEHGTCAYFFSLFIRYASSLPHGVANNATVVGHATMTDCSTFPVTMERLFVVGVLE